MALERGLQDVQRDLVAIGFSDHEAKVYVALVAIGPATAYELARQAGLPVPNTYNVIRGLMKRAATTQISARPARYVAVPPDQFFGTLASETQKRCDALVSRLSTLSAPANADYVEMLEGWATIERRLIALIAGSTRQLVLRSPSVLAPAVWEELRKAVDRNVECLFVYYGEKPDLPDLPHVRLWPHEGNGASLGPDFFTICADFSSALIHSQDRQEGAFSENRSFVYLAGVFLRHELYLAEIMMRFETEVEETFGPALYKLRQSFGMIPLGEEIRSFVRSRLSYEPAFEPDREDFSPAKRVPKPEPRKRKAKTG
ncbi:MULTISPECIES: helix-turn-helix domain-containing protein [unclassified Chelatococcus]|uniref:TrmB family transcriptional regulator n=1 Tax=unclassified Chelatococcus TaxID=2638111 RepID=UPI001BCDB56A|nr:MULTISPECIES: helix-turn-helix domain-containing protein [unclassified Chelatococcus]MBS7701077.1 hypothetical protein [Chelatococcus sp. YT9]MBX3555610.1 hypothetical protein [Chelatococcus sp.]